MSPSIENQINQVMGGLTRIFESHLLGVYVFGSLTMGDFAPYSDVDILVVLDQKSQTSEKEELVELLLKGSGLYMDTRSHPIELTTVVKGELHPWTYPPKFDFQYGEWLRHTFERGNIEPWETKSMPDLAIILTQVQLSSKTMLGPEPYVLLPKVPFKDFVRAMSEGVQDLIPELESDTRNVLLTLARIWKTLDTHKISTKPKAADWAIEHLTEPHRIVLERAKAICLGEQEEDWRDLKNKILPCAQAMMERINLLVKQLQREPSHGLQIELDHTGK